MLDIFISPINFQDLKTVQFGVKFLQNFTINLLLNRINQIIDFFSKYNRFRYFVASFTELIIITENYVF